MNKLKDFLNEKPDILDQLSQDTKHLLTLMGEADLFSVSDRCYQFGSKIYDHGRWLTEEGKLEPPGITYLGILLDKILEVSIPEPWGDKQSFRRPNTLLFPGDTFGTFEACDVLSQNFPAQNYTVFAGTPTFYFGDPLLDPSVTKGEHSSIKIARSLDAALLTKLDSKWSAPTFNSPSDRGLVLLRSITPLSELKKWCVRVLLIPITKSLFSDPSSNEIALLINEMAWKQSYHLRSTGIESYSSSDLSDCVRGNKDKFPEEYSADCVRELSAMRRVMLAERPGFRELKGSDKVVENRLEQHGPFTAFYKSLNAALSKAADYTSKVKWTGPSKIIPHVYVPDYLFRDKSELIYPIWLHACPEGDFSYAKGFSNLDKINDRKIDIDQVLFKEDSAYTASRYQIKSCKQQEFSPILLRGAAVICPNIEKLPIFDHEIIATNESRKLGGIVAVQHVMDETLVMFNEIVNRGIVAAENITIIGKPYSSNQNIADRLRQLGINVVIPDLKWKRGEFTSAFENVVTEQLSQSLTKIPQEKNTTVLLLDDGGSLVKAGSSIKKPKHRFVGVEQTSRGIAAAKSANFPVVLVACSLLKSRIEPEFVARAAVSKIARYYPEILSSKRVGIIGLGNVGGYFAKYILQRKDLNFDELRYFDEDHERVKKISTFAQVIGIDKSRHLAVTNIDDIIRDSETVFGCTGKALSWNFEVKNESINLISLTSNDVEFSSILQETNCNEGCHLDAFVTGNYRAIAGGFPITFDRDAVSAPLAEMQLTRALLLAAIEQAKATTQQRGPIMLDSKIQWEIWESWLKETGEEATDAGVLTWRTQREKEQLGLLGDLKTIIGSHEDFNNANTVAYNDAIEAVNKLKS